MAATTVVLMTAYYCRPDAGSEHFLAWNWVAAMAAEASIDLTVLTAEMNRPFIEAGPPIDAEFLYVSDEVRLPQVLPGELNDAARYLVYCRRADRVMRRSTRRFDVAHHVSWTNIRTVSPAFSAGCPVVFGPVGGAQLFPWRLRRMISNQDAVVEGMRNLQVLVSRYQRRTRAQIQAASVVVASNTETAAFATALGARSVSLMPDVPSLDEVPRRAKLPATGRLELLWVGRLLPRKALGLALEAVQRAGAEVDVRLTVVGHGPDDGLLSDLDPRVIRWLGQVPRADLDEVYAESHALLYTSLRDSGGPPLAEAMSFGMPAIIVDHQGPSLLGAGWTLGVRPQSMERTIDGLSKAIIRLAGDPDLQVSLGDAALARSVELSPAQRSVQGLHWYRQAQSGSDRPR